MSALAANGTTCLSVSRVCNDCAHACETHCARITPGVQPRWAAFERCGLAEQFEPGAKRNIAFMAWVKDEWRIWRRLNGHASEHLGPAEHAAFDAWLAARHDVPSPPKSEAP